MTLQNRRHADLEPIEMASRDELQALQLERLKWSLRHAYKNVRHYRHKFDATGVHPDDLKTLEDLAKFPFTTKQDLRENYPFGMFAVPEENVVRIHASSGTTGRPTVVGYTKKDIATWASVVARSMRAGGARRGDRVHIAYGYGLFTGGLGCHYGAESLGCMVIPMSGGQTEKQVQLIQDFEPRIIMSTPSYFLNIVEQMQKEGTDPLETSLELGFFGAEPWTEAMRADIERRTGMDAIDIYGLSEVMGPGVACECIESKDGPVIWEDHFYPEIIDPQSGEVLPNGVRGELVFTSLTKEALPVIRYRTRDLTTLQAPTSRSMRRMEKIAGRSDDMLIIRGVNVFPTQIEELILKHPELSPQYQLVVTREGHLDSLEVMVETALVSGNITGERGQKVVGQLQYEIKTFVGVSPRVSLVEPQTLVRSTGKAKRVVDHRNL